MKPYIMLYSECFESLSSSDFQTEASVRTFKTETDDEDYINLSLTTIITKVSESNDADNLSIKQLQLGTMLTERTENNDHDFQTLTTIQTNVSESSDSDHLYH